MIAHVAIRRHQLGECWLYAHGWVLGAKVGAGLAESRADAIRKACIDALSAGAKCIALPAMRDYPAALGLIGPNCERPTMLRTHHDPAAVAVALRAASIELMRECIRRRGVPDLGSEPRAIVEQLGGPETVAAVIGCDPAQVVRWGWRGWPDVRLKSLRRELAYIGAA